MSKRNILIILAIVVIGVIVIILISGSSQSIPEDKFVELYIKLALTHQRYKYNPPELEKEKQRILEQYKVTMGDVEEFLKEYKKNPERWVKLWEKINQELERLERKGSFTPP